MANVNELLGRQNRGNWLDFARGALMGVSTDVLGYPVDLATMALRPLGYSVDKPVGGSDWLAEKLTRPTNSLAELAGRTITGMATPGPNELLRMAGIVGRAPVNELTVYHSSPHRINNVPQPPAKSHAISHRPMSDAGGAARLHDLTPAFGEDIYGSNALQYFGSGDPREAAVLPILRQVRGNPSADVTIYRGVPSGAGDNIDVGDWVTLDKSVAQQYAGEGGKVIAKKVKAIDVTAWPDSLHEYGYFPDPYGKFDLSKIGTGEGAQAYGHGIYLAESPGVAKAYQVNLARDPRDEINAIIGDLSRKSGKGRVTQTVDELSNELSKNPILAPVIAENPSLVKDIRTLAYGFDGSSHSEAALAAARRLDSILPQGKGHFYTVDLPDEHIAKMLDWDAPLSEQPEAVKKLLRGSDIAPDESVWDQYTGQQLYEGEMQAGGPYKASGWANAESRKAVSEKLRSLGIPGIKYFDGGSRAAGEGTRNFVIFDGDTAKILKRE